MKETMIYGVMGMDSDDIRYQYICNKLSEITSTDNFSSMLKLQ